MVIRPGSGDGTKPRMLLCPVKRGRGIQAAKELAGNVALEAHHRSGGQPNHESLPRRIASTHPASQPASQPASPRPATSRLTAESIRIAVSLPVVVPYRNHAVSRPGSMMRAICPPGVIPAADSISSLPTWRHDRQNADNCCPDERTNRERSDHSI